MPSQIAKIKALMDNADLGKVTVREALDSIFEDMDRRISEGENKDRNFDALKAQLTSNILASTSEVLTPIATDFQTLLANSNALYVSMLAGEVANVLFTDALVNTAAPGDNSEKIANTAFVVALLAASIASQAQAEAGVDNARFMTALRVAQRIAALRGSANGLASLDGDGLVPAAQIPLLGANNGIATLDVNGKLTTAQIPTALVGALQYQGTWNATTNTPAIPGAAAGNKGQFYKVATAGATTVDGINDWKVGDWIVSNGASWDKIDNTDQVASVAGLTGAMTAAALKTALAIVAADITDGGATGRQILQAANAAAAKALLALVKADVGLGNVDNTSDVNKPISTATQTALDTKAWVLLNSVQFAAGGGGTATVNIGGFSATYDNYVIVFDGVQPVNGNDPLHLRLAVNGGAVATGSTDYRWARQSVDESGTVGGIGSNGANKIDLAATISNTANLAASGRVWLFSVNANAPQRVMWEIEHHSTGAEARSQGVGRFTGNGVLSTVRFQCVGGGNISTGNFYLYGLRK